MALLAQAKLAEAADLAQIYDRPLSQARVALAQGDPVTALALLEPLCNQAKINGWHDELLQVFTAQAIAYAAQGEQAEALQRLSEALTLAEPDGLIRVFVDEGAPMAGLLAEAVAHGIAPEYVKRLLLAFAVAAQPTNKAVAAPALAEPLSDRELEVLQLVAQGLSNREISEQLFLALDTVKGHNRRIFGKLQVQRRTEAVARARELGLV